MLCYREGALEGQDVTEERSIRLWDQLEQRVAALLGELRQARAQRDALHHQLAELERHRAELEVRNAELAGEARASQANHQALSQRCAELQARLAELEASGRELAEENRELDAQNRELEAHNHRLLAREPAQPGGLFHRQARRAQGLSALIGHRPPQPEPAAEAVPAAHAPSAPPVPEPALEAGEPGEEAPPSPQALLDQWYRRYDATFFKGHTRPLQVGIHEALTAREPWPEKLVRRALACYVNLPRYLKSVREGAERLDLAGQPAGQVDAAAAEHARKKLERLQAGRRQRGRPARHTAGKPRDARAVPEAPNAAATVPGAGEPSPTRQANPESGAHPATHALANPREPREPATLEEKLSALLAKHNQR